MVQGTGLSLHCSLLNQFCPWTNSNSIYQNYLAENLNVGYIAVNLSGQIWGHEQVSSWSGKSGAWTTPSPHWALSHSHHRAHGWAACHRVSPAGHRQLWKGLSAWEGAPDVQTPHWTHLTPCMLLRLVRIALLKFWPQAYRVQHPPFPSVPTETCRMTSSSAPGC